MARVANDAAMTSQKIRVTSELRARDVPPGTRVTPRGREYMLLGLAGGWIAGGVCMYLTWNLSHPVLSALKVLGAATAGSLLGTLVSWVMPGTRARMRVIREMKTYIAEERKAEAQAMRAKLGVPVEEEAIAREDVGCAPAAGEKPPSALRYVSSAPDETVVNVVFPADAGPAPAETRRPRPLGQKGSVSPPPEGDANALVEAIGELTTIDPDAPPLP